MPNHVRWPIKAQDKRTPTSAEARTQPIRQVPYEEKVRLDRYLSLLTRRIASLPGVWRLLDRLRRFCAARYARNGTGWVVIDDFDGDLKFRVNRSSYLGGLIYWRGHHSLNERILLDRLLKPWMVFADVGANQGELTVFAAKRLPAGRVLAFEPVETVYRHLLENVRLNGFENVTAYNFGLADKPECVDFYFYQSAPKDSSNSQFSSYEHTGTMFQDNPQSTKIGIAKMEVFDEIFAKTGLNRLDVVKIDVEGAELHVLQGARNVLRQYEPTIIMEINEGTYSAAGYSPKDVLDFLEDLNYIIYMIGPRGRIVSMERRELPAFCNIICKPAS